MFSWARKLIQEKITVDPAFNWALAPVGRRCPRFTWEAVAVPQFVRADRGHERARLPLFDGAGSDGSGVGSDGSNRRALRVVLRGRDRASLGAARLYLGRLSQRENPTIKPLKDHAKTVAASEDQDHSVQNQMSSVIFMKQPRWFRLLLLRFVLRALNFSARHIFVDGRLGGINSIHFARWALVDNNRRLLFFSNFDGTWESYLGEFVDKAAKGLTGVWSNCEGFPRTNLLTGGGAAAEARFKAYTRNSQIPTQVWYSAYPNLTVANINKNSKIRQELPGEMTEAEAQRWLELF